MAVFVTLVRHAVCPSRLERGPCWLHALDLSNFCQKLDTKSDSNSIHSSIQSDLLKKVANSESSPLARNFYLTSPNSGVNVDTSFPNEMQVAAISDPDYLDIEVLFDSMTKPARQFLNFSIFQQNLLKIRSPTLLETLWTWKKLILGSEYSFL